MSKFKTSPGSPIHQLYSPKYDDRGVLSLVPSGKVNTQDMINSYSASTDISYIMNRLLAKDYSVISRNTPMFGDFTKVPHSFAEILNVQLDAKAHFDSLPESVRASFNNDYLQFLATSGSEDWLRKLGISPAPSPLDTIPDKEDLPDA